MVVVEECSVVFDESSGDYRDGETLCGHVTLELTHFLEYKDLLVEVRGVTIIDLESNRNKKTSSKQGKHEEHFFKRTKLLSQEKLTKGLHKFSFQFELPRDIPSSFSGQYGKISYEVVVLVDTTQESTILCSKSFKVSAGLDLSFVPEAATRINICKYKEKGWCCFDQVVSARWCVDSSGYVPNEVIVIRTFVDSDTSRINITNTVLYKIVSYRTDKKKKVEKVGIATAIPEMSLTKNGTTEKVELLTIPDTPVTGLCKNRFLDISYELQFMIEVVNSKITTLVASSDIYIGSEPLNLQQLKSYVAVVYRQPHLQTSSSNPSAPPSNYDSLNASNYFHRDLSPSFLASETRRNRGWCTPPPPYSALVHRANN